MRPARVSPPPAPLAARGHQPRPAVPRHLASAARRRRHRLGRRHGAGAAGDRQAGDRRDRRAPPAFPAAVPGRRRHPDRAEVAETADAVAGHGVQQRSIARGVRGLDRSPVINIDHHPGNTHYGTINWVDEVGGGVRRARLHADRRARRAAHEGDRHAPVSRRSSPTPGRSTSRTSRRAPTRSPAARWQPAPTRSGSLARTTTATRWRGCRSSARC